MRGGRGVDEKGEGVDERERSSYAVLSTPPALIIGFDHTQCLSLLLP